VYSLSGARFAPEGQSGGAISAFTGWGKNTTTTTEIAINIFDLIMPP
jgi:hypothetical protein